MTEPDQSTEPELSARTRLLGHFRALLAAEVLVRLLLFGTAVAVARVLGPRELGFVSVALAALSYAVVLGDGGLTSLTQLRLINAGGQDDVLISSTTALQVGLAALAAGVLAAAAWLLPFPHPTRILVLWSLPILLAQALNTLYVLEAGEQMTTVARLRTFAQVTATSICLAALALGLGGPSVPLSRWAGLLLADLACVAVLRRGRRWHLVRPDPSVVRDVAASTAPYLLALLATQVIINADIVVLGLSRPAKEVGEYEVAFRLASSTLSLIAVLITAVFPELVRRLGGQVGAASSLLLRLVRLSCRPAFALLALVALAAHPLIKLLYGTAYHDAGRYLPLVFALVPLGFYNSILAQSLVAAGRQTAYLRVVGTTAVLTVVALVVTVPSYGAWAAAGVVVMGELASGAALTFAVRDLQLRPLPVAAAQLPFLVLPLAAGLLARNVVGTPTGVAIACAAVTLLICEAFAPNRLVGDVREIVLGSRPAR